MRRSWRRLRLAGLLVVAAALAAGCNLSALPYFLSGAEAKQPPILMKLASDDKKKEVKVAIFVYSGVSDRPEFMCLERELSGALTRYLKDGCKANEEKVDIIPPGKVQDYKNTHPDWHAESLQELGKHFEADYVIYIEVMSMSLYEQGSAKQLYRGKAELAVTVVNMKTPDDDPIEQPYRCEYPASRPIMADDQNARQFYTSFLNYVAEHIAWYFTAHPTSEDYRCD
jgi:hypothetical protein